MSPRAPVLHYFAAVKRLGAAALVLAFLLTPAAAQDSAIAPERADDLFAKVDGMLAILSDITGLEIRKPIPRELITRDEIRELIETRIAEETSPEQVRLDELFLKLFGFVDDDFDLQQELVDVLTEQATALYDFKTRKLYLASWTPEDMQEFALVHELAHALADQHFNLEKYVNKAKSADGDIARSAVMEGQASWLMTEYVFKETGRSLATNRLAAITTAAASRFEAEQYPVFSAAPLFLRETMLFPYVEGLLFQQAVVEKRGQAGFREVFERPPLTSQHIMEPEAYFARRKAAHPPLPKAKPGRGFKQVARGAVGQLDHHVLLKQYFSEDEADSLSPRWRGGHYRIYENKAKDHAVLAYASRWQDAEATARFFDLYKQVCKKKWRSAVFESETPRRVTGVSETGRFVLALHGTVVSSIEGLPGDTLKAYTAVGFQSAEITEPR